MHTGRRNRFSGVETGKSEEPSNLRLVTVSEGVGEADVVAADIDGDGVVDLYGMDVDGDGIVDVAANTNAELQAEFDAAVLAAPEGRPVPPVLVTPTVSEQERQAYRCCNDYDDPFYQEFRETLKTSYIQETLETPNTDDTNNANNTERLSRAHSIDVKAMSYARLSQAIKLDFSEDDVEQLDAAIASQSLANRMAKNALFKLHCMFPGSTKRYMQTDVVTGVKLSEDLSEEEGGRLRRREKRMKELGISNDDVVVHLVSKYMGMRIIVGDNTIPKLFGFLAELMTKHPCMDMMTVYKANVPEHLEHCDAVFPKMWALATLNETLPFREEQLEGHNRLYMVLDVSLDELVTRTGL